MTLKQRATKCSGYIPPSQYVPVYSRPHRTSNVRRHEELSPITPKPSFDDPDSARSRSIQQAVKAWLESSPKSVIGVRGRSPTDSPRTSVSSPDPAVAIPVNGEANQSLDGVIAESPSFQKSKLAPWRNTAGNGGGSQSKADDHTPTEEKISAGDQSITEEEPAVQAKKSTVTVKEVTSDIDPQTDNYSQAIMEALKSSPKAPESYLKPPRVLEKLGGQYGAQDTEEILPKTSAFESAGDMDEIRGKQLEDFPARGYDEKRLGGGGGDNFHAMNKGGDDSAWDSESLAEETNYKSGFMSSSVSSPISFVEERRFGGEGMNLIQIAGSGEFAAKSVPQEEKSKIESDIDSSPATPEFDLGAETKRPTRYFQSGRTTQPLYETVGFGVSAHSPLTTRQEERYEAQPRFVSGSSTQYGNGGKRDGPTKTAAVVPAPEDSQCSTDYNIEEEKPSTPLQGVDSNQMRWPNKPFNRQETLERIRQEKFLTQAAAFEEAKKSQFLNRYKREEMKILAWEDHKKAKAEINLRKVELKLQEKRAKAIEKMENELARARKRAEEKKAMAEAKRGEKAARASEEADLIRQHGRRPLSLFCFTP